jgi:hypothetical protein
MTLRQWEILGSFDQLFVLPIGVIDERCVKTLKCRRRCVPNETRLLRQLVRRAHAASSSSPPEGGIIAVGARDGA